MSAQPTSSDSLSRQTPRVLVSVLSYNSPQNTIETLRCLQHQTYSPFHLLVIDNASRTNCVEQIRRTLPDLDIKVLEENLGYTGGNNFALRQAFSESYDYAVVCNNDIEVDEYAIQRLIETAAAHNDAGVVGGVEISFATGKKRAYGGGRYCPWISRPRWLTRPPSEKGPSFEVPCVHGALVLFTKQALESGVFFDENLFMYMDEIDIGIQLKEKDLRAYTSQRVLFRHKSEPYQFHEYTGYLTQRNRLYIVKKYGAWYHQLFYNLYSLFLELPAKICLRVLQGHGRFAVACVLGHFDGLLGRLDRNRLQRYLSS